jgi:acyl carrier protein
MCRTVSESADRIEIVDQIERRVLDIVARTFRVPRGTISLESTSDTIPTWDSLQQVHLILALEEEFGIQFEVDQIAVMQGVRPILALVRERAGAG